MTVMNPCRAAHMSAVSRSTPPTADTFAPFIHSEHVQRQAETAVAPVQAVGDCMASERLKRDTSGHVWLRPECTVLLYSVAPHVDSVSRSTNASPPYIQHQVSRLLATP